MIQQVTKEIALAAVVNAKNAGEKSIDLSDPKNCVIAKAARFINPGAKVEAIFSVYSVNGNPFDTPDDLCNVLYGLLNTESDVIPIETVIAALEA